MKNRATLSTVERDVMNLNLQAKLATASWFPATTVHRPFVRYWNPGQSQGWIWHEKPANREILLSIIVPTSDAYRNGLFHRLLGQR